MRAANANIHVFDELIAILNLYFILIYLSRPYSVCDLTPVSHQEPYYEAQIPILLDVFLTMNLTVFSRPQLFTVAFLSKLSSLHYFPVLSVLLLCILIILICTIKVIRQRTLKQFQLAPKFESCLRNTI